MKVMWIANRVTKEIASDLGIGGVEGPSWVEGALNIFANTEQKDFAYCFPHHEFKVLKKGECRNIKYYGFPLGQSVDPVKYDINVEEYLRRIFKDFKPDILHIFGTEFPHSLAAVNAFNKKGRVIIDIQGLCYIYTKHYNANLPCSAIHNYTLRDLVRNDNIFRQAKRFQQRGIFEIQAIRKVQHICGRTSWDKACVAQVNDKAKYYSCNRILRNEFYKNKWEYDKCEKYSIFISQAIYPLKGLHFMLEAMPQILKKFPDTKLYIAGPNIAEHKTLKDNLRITSYGKYIKKLIKLNKLDKSVFFTGNLSEIQMCDRYLKSHVFVCPSSIENSPNSLGEAMILGVPCVASYVGGIPDMLEHYKDGFLYHHEASYMIAHYICEIFENEKLALSFSKSARERASKTHNREVNLNNLMNIYRYMLRGQQ